MVSDRSLPPPAMAFLKLILVVSKAYYAKVLPLHRKSLEHRRRRRHGKVRNSKGLRVKIPIFKHNVPLPWVLVSPVPQPIM